MRLLSLDLATRLGWAVGDLEHGDPVWGEHRLPSGNDDTQMFFLAYGIWLKEMLAAEKPNVIVMEAPMGGSSVMNAITDYKLKGLCVCTELVAAGRQVPVRQVPAGTWKKSFTGTGRFGKSTKPYPPIEACAARGWAVKTDNMADALGIFVHGVGALAPGSVARFEPLFRASTNKAA
jgi:hypothetical protein